MSAGLRADGPKRYQKKEAVAHCSIMVQKVMIFNPWKLCGLRLETKTTASRLLSLSDLPCVPSPETETFQYHCPGTKAVSLRKV